jgi:hypothetical protein
MWRGCSVLVDLGRGSVLVDLGGGGGVSFTLIAPVHPVHIRKIEEHNWLNTRFSSN